ncbi:uncharacterized protein LOC130421259 [Triplophysa dalaica]|uniref:uncharacterized protein LOC130421259 n=1 Tax=Triplophysa dalaica TaxID=1582913 RepID=UPI0024E0137A|nr:uncharacterized protein LOC130421259 [Triplophysa dalaica]
MADKIHICLLGQIILSLLFTDVTADINVFTSSGENVILSCNNPVPQCNSTTWMYKQYSRSTAVDLFIGGIKMIYIDRSERLSLTSDCSFNIYKTTQDDRGLYICQQYVNKYHYRTYARVYLHVLHVFSSATQTEIRAHTSVTLYCQLYTYDCNNLVQVNGFQLVWVNRSGFELQTNSRYQIKSQHSCLVTLTTTLMNEDNNTEFRCVLKMRNDTKTRASYTLKFTDSSVTETTSTSNRLESVNSSESGASFIRVILLLMCQCLLLLLSFFF